MTDARLPTTEQLVSEMAWVRQLARALVRDGSADDIAQETWLVANEQQPDADRPLRPWLSRVVRTLAFTRRRSEARRSERDSGVTDDRGVPTPAELVERVELQRIVADEVLALAEPYRSTILLHFVEGYTSAQIARRLDIPDGTVRRRLKVALDQLRDALRARTDQPRRGWLAALIPLAQRPGAMPAALGGIAMKKLLGALLLLLLLIGGGVLWWHRSREVEPASTTATARSTAVRPGHAVAIAEVPAFAAIPGAPARRIAGRVVFRGAPVGGAKVLLGLEVTGEPSSTLVAPDAMTNVLQRIAEATTSPDGTFDFGVQPAGVFTVSASSTSSAPRSVHVDNADPRTRSDQLVLVLAECATRLSGTVADASGGAIAKARISVAGLSGGDSDETGAYSVCITARDAFGLPSTPIRVEADGYGTVLQTIIVAGSLRHDFLLAPEAVIVGTVATNDGAPLAGARVTANPEPSEMGRHLASRWADTDREGHFRIVGLGAGAFQVGTYVRGLGRVSVAAIARPTSTSREIHLVLERARLARVTGRVYAGGSPTGGVPVQVAQGGRMGGSALSQADGSFVVTDVPYGAWQIFAGAAQTTAATAITIAQPNVDDVRVEVAKQASIRGRVVFAGAPVADASVWYVGPPQATLFGPPPFTRTGSDGTFVLDNVPVGPGQVIAWSNASKGFADPRPVDVAPGTDVDVVIDFEYSGEVTGTVVDGAGAPVPNVFVGLARPDGDRCEAMTDAKGAFDCFQLAGGEYRATVTPLPGGRQGFVLVDPSPIQVPKVGVTSGVRIAIVDERVAIRGTVVDDTGAPLPDVYVDAVAPGFDASMDPPSMLSDAAGRFEIANLAHGTYTLQAHAADGSEATLPGVIAGTTTASLRLARAGAIEGTLVGFTSMPSIFVFGANPMERMRGGRALVDGASFSRVALSPGRYAVEATAGADTDATLVDVEPGKTTRVELHSRGVGTIDATVVELGTRAPVPRMRCEGQTTIDGRGSRVPSDPSYQAFTDPAGHVIVRAPIGRARIVCFLVPTPPPPGAPPPAMFSIAAADVDVASGAPTTVTLFSVRATFGPSPSDPGFMLSPALLPILVSQVVPDGPAAALRVNDELLAVDGIPVTGLTPDGAMWLLMNHRPGTIATLEISRGGAKQTLKITLRGR